MANNVKLTRRELKAVQSLRALAKRWPPSLWLFCNGTLHIMKRGPEGEREMTERGGVNSDYLADCIDGIHADGGDW